MDGIAVVHFLNGLLMLLLPIGVAIYLTYRWRMGWRLLLIGGATFILSQVVHIPFNSIIFSWIENSIIVDQYAAVQFLVSTTVLSLSAGIFEEGARYIVLRKWAKDARTWRSGILFGLGHGGAESLILGGLVLLFFFQLSAIRYQDLSTIVSPDYLAEAQAQMQAYWSSTWYDSLLGALERLFVLPSQIAMALIVMQVFLRKQIRWLFAAIFYHAVLNFSAMYVLQYFGAYWAEAVTGGMAVLSVVIIVLLRRPESESGEQSADVKKAKSSSIKPIRETRENLDRTRFQD